MTTTQLQKHKQKLEKWVTSKLEKWDIDGTFRVKQSIKFGTRGHYEGWLRKRALVQLEAAVAKDDKRKAKLRKKMGRAATRVQAAARGRQAREFARLLPARRAAAIRIQRHIRGSLVRQDAKARPLRDAMATRLQARARGNAVRSAIRAAPARHSAAKRIQAAARGRRCRFLCGRYAFAPFEEREEFDRRYPLSAVRGQVPRLQHDDPRVEILLRRGQPVVLTGSCVAAAARTKWHDW